MTTVPAATRVATTAANGLAGALAAALTSASAAAASLLAAPLPRPAAARRGESGQASAEYALVLLGVAAVALLVTAWAAKTDGIGRLFDAVMDKLVDSVK